MSIFEVGLKKKKKRKKKKKKKNKKKKKKKKKIKKKKKKKKQKTKKSRKRKQNFPIFFIGTIYLFLGVIFDIFHACKFLLSRAWFAEIFTAKHDFHAHFWRFFSVFHGRTLFSREKIEEFSRVTNSVSRPEKKKHCSCPYKHSCP